MRILIVNKFLYPNGGSETYIFKTGQQLRKAGHEVEYFGMAHEGNIVANNAGSYTEDMSFTGAGAKLKKLTYPFKIIYSRDARRKIRLVLDDFRPEVVHLNNINFQITPSIIDEIRLWEKENGTGVRIVATAHDSMWVCPGHLMRIPSTGELCQRCIDGRTGNCARYRCIHDSKLQSILGTIEADFYRKRGTYRQVDTIICPSRFMNDVLSHHPDLKGRTVTLHNFIDITPENTGMAGGISAGWYGDFAAGMNHENIRTAVDSGTRQCGALREGVVVGRVQDHISPAVRSVLDRKTPYVLYFGRYDLEKGIRTLMSVCCQLPEVDFVFAGKGEYEKELESIPNITNVGFQSGRSLTELIRGARFTVFPSECYENCPFTVMESEMNGTPVVASRLGGIPELIEEGVTGELFRAGDDDELAGKVLRLWNDDALTDSYRQGCRNIAAGRGHLRFLNLEEYCARLVQIYSGTEH